MGPIRKVGAAAQQVSAAASESRALIADLADGFAAEVEVDWDLVVDQFKKALTGQLKGKSRLPIKFIINPKVDA